MELSDWSRDGRFLIGTLGNARTQGDIWLWPMKDGLPDGKPFPYLHTAFNERFPKLSPDGHWLAYSSDETKRDEVYVQSFPMPGQKIQISSNGGDRPVWSRDGKELYFIDLNQKITAVPVKTGAKFEADAPKELFEVHMGQVARSGSFDISSNGRFVIPNSIGESATQPMTESPNDCPSLPDRNCRSATTQSRPLSSNDSAYRSHKTA